MSDQNQANQVSQPKVSETRKIKDYYTILDVPFEATQDQIDEAYNKLAVKWHPQKNKENRLQAHKKFKDACEAYEILGDKTKREHYDHLIKPEGFSLQQAEKIFENFYGQFGVLDEDQRKFFEDHYPGQTKNYYQILGVTPKSTLEQIQEAYRKLAIHYHPKKNPGNQQAKKKFVEVNQAYKALSDEKSRQTYHTLAFGQIQPIKAHSIFEDFFSDRYFKFPEEHQFFRPLIQNKWKKRLDQLMNDPNEHGTFQNEETRKTHQVYTNKNGLQSRKVVKTHRKVKDGKPFEEIVEEYELPTGEREIHKITKDGDVVDKKVYHLKKDEELPKQLTNGNA